MSGDITEMLGTSISLLALLAFSWIPSTLAILSPVKYARYDDSLLHPVDFVHHNIRQSRNYPFERIGIATHMADKGK
ncbi:hypothetical protein V1292_003822 [Bradyrhizobium sp. AZCC 1719]